jgi:radical SAM protein with 4Fe4S-binding SPASM domain
VRDVHIEPIFSSGRGAGYAADNSRFQASFAKQFMEAQNLGRDLGVAVTYSGCSTPRVDGSFCGATGQEPNFVVMSGGLVSSCYEVSKESHKLGEFFIYGHYNRQLKAFEFSQERVQRLMQYGASEDSPCRSCFAQRNCFGDCLTRRDLDQLISGSGSSSRCSLNRDVLSRTIAQQVDDRTLEPHQ